MNYDKKLKELRIRAEKKLKTITARLDGFSEKSMEQLLHELNVYQIELEMQNDELKRSNENLSASRNAFTVLYEKAPVAYITVNKTGQIGMANNRFYEMLDISRSVDMRRKSLSEFIYFEDINIFYSLFKHFYSKPDKYEINIRLKFSEEIKHVVMTGYRAPELLGMMPEVGDYDFMVVLHDVTKEKLLEGELHKKNAELEDFNSTLREKVQEETSQRVKHEQMMFEQKKFADMGEMLSSIAHQWRQPLNVLGLLFQSASETCAKGTPAEFAEYSKTGLEVINYLSETITDFREFFKPAKEKKNFNLTGAVQTSIRLVRTQMEESGIDIVLKCSCDNHSVHIIDFESPPECLGKAPNVIGYENEFKQIFMNVIYNSRDAIIASGRDTDGEIKITLENFYPVIKISVEDNGGGVDERIADKIFEPYFTTKNEMNGTGIGLYMCKTILEKHFNGKISFVNGEKGAVFTISILID